ncbi:MAG: hypothetical protein ACHQQQ_12875 [Bacteroidota bacterium]
MKTARIIYRMIIADVLERCRRYSFLVTMAGALYIGYAVYRGYIQMHFSEYRGIYNCAWLGTLSAIAVSLFISFAGFYVVKNSIDRDRRTGVGEILATTPIGKIVYLLAKAFSNFAVLMAIVLVEAVSIFIMVFLKHEDTGVDLWALYSPFLFLAIPAMAITAAIAVLFESVRFLRGGAGNVIFFFLWTASLSVPMVNNIHPLDLSGAIYVEDSIQSAVAKFDSQAKGGFSYNAGPQEEIKTLKTFTWQGIQWTPAIIIVRFSWFLYSLLMVLLASLFFDRFDNALLARAGSAPDEKTKKGKRFAALRAGVDRWTSFEWVHSRSTFSRMLAVELMLMLRGLSLWWYLPALGLIIASLLSPMDAVREGLFPVVWVWPILIWSRLGTREDKYGTGQIIFSSPNILSRQFPAMLTAGVMLSLATASGVLVRFGVAGDVGSIATTILGAVFIPLLALAFGVWSKSSKLFEVIYLLLWYIGPMNHVAALDFTFTSPGSFSSGMPFAYVTICGILLVAAISGRRKQMVF